MKRSHSDDMSNLSEVGQEEETCLSVAQKMSNNNMTPNGVTHGSSNQRTITPPALSDFESMLLESTDLNIVIFDSNLRITYCTQRARHLFRTLALACSTSINTTDNTRTPANFVGLRLEDVCRPFCHLQQTVQAAVQTRQASTTDCVVQSTTQPSSYYLVQVTPTQSREGTKQGDLLHPPPPQYNPHAVTLTFFDITERKRKEMNSQSLVADVWSIYDNAPVGLFVVNDKMQYVRVNQTMAKINMKDVQQHVGRFVGDFVLSDFTNQLAAVIRKVFESRQAIVDSELLGKPPCDPENIHEFSISCFPIFVEPMKDQVISANVIIRDTTEIKQKERDLVAAKLKAEEADKQKSRFLAQMSHELRTPMVGILGMANVLGDSSLTPEQFDYLTTIQESADSLLQVLNDILDLSKVEAGKVVLENADFDLWKEVEKAAYVFISKASEKKISYEINIDPSMNRFYCGDAGRIRQIVTNFISNAIKFTDKGGVTLKVKRCGASGGTPVASDNNNNNNNNRNGGSNNNDKDNNNNNNNSNNNSSSSNTSSNNNCNNNCVDDLEGKHCVQISVVDTGIGIHDGDTDKIFGEFIQVEGATKRPGTGLGLPIVKHLSELMHGHVTVKSEVGRGSTFTAYLWLDACNNPDIIAKHPTPPQIDGSAVLILDHMDYVIKYLEDIFHVKNIVRCKNLENAVAITSTVDCTLVVVECDDLSQLTHRRQLFPPDIIVIWLMPYLQPQWIQRFKRESPGHDVFLPKPLRLSTFIDRLGSAWQELKRNQNKEFLQKKNEDDEQRNANEDNNNNNNNNSTRNSRDSPPKSNGQADKATKQLDSYDGSDDVHVQVQQADNNNNNNNEYGNVSKNNSVNTATIANNSNNPAMQVPTTLPAVAATGSSESSSVLPSTPQQKRIQVLLVEDNFVNQKVLLKTLLQTQCDVAIANNGVEAVNMVKGTQYDIILMDCQMPIMDGYEATTRIREFEKQNFKHHVPIIALTAHAMNTDRDKCIQCGMDDYLTKPVHKSKLQEIIAQYCKDDTLGPDMASAPVSRLESPMQQ